MALMESPTSVIESFFDSLKSPKTRQSYGAAIRGVLPDPAGFLVLADQNRWQAQALLIEWISKNRNRLSPHSVKTYMASVRSLTEFAEISLNWKKVMKVCLSPGRPKDEAPSIEIIQKLFEISDLRGKFIISLLASSGVRIGSFDFFTLRDLKEVEAPGSKVIGELTVYRSEREEYKTFVSAECLSIFREYLKFRERWGEKLTPDSPLIRVSFGPEKRPDLKRDTNRALSSHTLQVYFRAAWKKVGLTQRNFKLLHGFRKFFKTELELAGLKTVFIERLLGHSDGLNENYLRIKSSDLAKEYAKHMLAVTIGVAERVKVELNEKVEKSEKEKEAAKNEYYLRWKQTEDRVMDLETNLREVLNLLEAARLEREKES